MTEEELKKYYELFVDAWKMLKKYHKPQPKDSPNYEKFWQLLVKDADLLFKKYGESVLAKDIILGVAEEVERIEKDERWKKYVPPVELVEPEGLQPIQAEKENTEDGK